jgi:hypothetical protein
VRCSTGFTTGAAIQPHTGSLGKRAVDAAPSRFTSP